MSKTQKDKGQQPQTGPAQASISGESINISNEEMRKFMLDMQQQMQQQMELNRKNDEEKRKQYNAEYYLNKKNKLKELEELKK